MIKGKVTHLNKALPEGDNERKEAIMTESESINDLISGNQIMVVKYRDIAKI